MTDADAQRHAAPFRRVCFSAIKKIGPGQTSLWTGTLLGFTVALVDQIALKMATSESAAA